MLSNPRAMRIEILTFENTVTLKTAYGSVTVIGNVTIR